MIRKASLAISALAVAGILSLQPTEAAAQERVRCESVDRERTYCTADTRAGVRLVRQISSADCVSGRTWGADRRGIWVTRGCRADFEVASRYSRNDRNRDDRDRNGRDWDRDGDYDRNDRGVRVVPRARGAEVVERQQAERVCRDAVRSRVRSNTGGVIRVAYEAQYRDGSRRVLWTHGRIAGNCRVSQNERLVGFNYDRGR
jgi:hypothetical protein